MSEGWIRAVFGRWIEMVSPMSGFAVASGLLEPLRVSFSHRVTGASSTRVIPEPFAFFGRHTLNTVQLDDPGVSKKHAYLQVIDGCPLIVDLGSRSGMRLGGASVGQAWWDPGQTLQIGDFDIRISGPLLQPGDRPQPTAVRDGDGACQIALVSGTDTEGLIHCPLRCAITLIGRDPTCNFRLIDERLRQFHAGVVQTPSDAWLVDLLGSGSTRVNGRAVRSSILQVGDIIGLNGVNLEVQLIRSESSRSGSNGVLQPVTTRMGRYSPADEGQPLVEQVGDLRQATLLMASLFTEMKREQTQMIQRQNALMEILVDVFRDGRTPALPPTDKPTPSPDASPAPKETPLQTPRMAKPGDEEALAKAHEWFLHRLHSLNKSGS